VAAEIARRDPEIRVVESHPDGRAYDCLDLLLEPDRAETSFRISLNRSGSAHVLCRHADSREMHWSTFWANYLAAENPCTVIDRLCDLAGLRSACEPPRTTTSQLVYRFVAAFLSSDVWGDAHWECRSAVLNKSPREWSVRGDMFACFPGARERLRVHLGDDVLGQPAFRYWFLCDPAPRLCLETGGLAWDADGNEFDLTTLYRATHRIWPVVSFVARDLLG
jgi:hypothetical protein